jgi:hypothetical protein
MQGAEVASEGNARDGCGWIVYQTALVQGKSDPPKAIPLQDGTGFTRVVPCLAQRGNVEEALLKAARRIDD